MDITHITSLLGGIALFLYGMSIMGAGLEKLAGGKMDMPYRNSARSDESAAENPFPQLFPNSYWKKRQNDRRLFGKARVRGVMYGIVAVPSASRRPPAGLCGNLRRVRSNSGSWFWLGIRRE